ncbi:MAG: hypothetical protein AABP62_00905 [Planctomycetota bacterium]
MFRAGLTFLRRLLCATILLVLIACGAEVAVRIGEVVQGRSICSTVPSTCLIDPTGLLVPSWTAHRELKPHATAKVACRDSRSQVEIRTNSHGLRGPEIVVPKPADLYRIVLLGDETILAPEMPEAEHCTRLLAGLLQQRTRVRVEVINAGLPGACPLTEYLLFKQRLLALQPDLVLLHFDWSDVSDDQQLRRRTRCDKEGTPLSCPHASLVATKRVAEPLDNLRQQFRLIDWGLTSASQQWKQKLAEQNASTRDTTANPYAWLREERPDANVSVQQSFHPVADLARLSYSAHFQLAVVTSPKPWQVSSRCSAGKGTRLASGVADDAYFPSRAPFDSLADYATNLGLQYADASMTLMSGHEADANFLRYAPRWSPTGHRRIAEFLASFLDERIPGPWNSGYLPQDEQPIGRAPRQSAPVQWASGER